MYISTSTVKARQPFPVFEKNQLAVAFFCSHKQSPSLVYSVYSVLSSVFGSAVCSARAHFV